MKIPPVSRFLRVLKGGQVLSVESQLGGYVRITLHPPDGVIGEAVEITVDDLRWAARMTSQAHAEGLAARSKFKPTPDGRKKANANR